MYNIKEETIKDFIVVSKTSIEEEFLDCSFEIRQFEGVPVLTVYNQYDDIIAVFNDFDYFRLI